MKKAGETVKIAKQSQCAEIVVSHSAIDSVKYLNSPPALYSVWLASLWIAQCAKSVTVPCSA